MEAIVILALFGALGLLSSLYGHDSRYGLRSKEQELALYGVTWSELELQNGLAGEIEMARHQRVAALSAAVAP